MCVGGARGSEEPRGVGSGTADGCGVDDRWKWKERRSCAQGYECWERVRVNRLCCCWERQFCNELVAIIRSGRNCGCRISAWLIGAGYGAAPPAPNARCQKNHRFRLWQLGVAGFRATSPLLFFQRTRRRRLRLNPLSLQRLNRGTWDSHQESFFSYFYLQTHKFATVLKMRLRVPGSVLKDTFWRTPPHQLLERSSSVPASVISGTANPLCKAVNNSDVKLLRHTFVKDFRIKLAFCAVLWRTAQSKLTQLCFKSKSELGKNRRKIIWFFLANTSFEKKLFSPLSERISYEGRITNFLKWLSLWG
jgi:hypothetical protein